VVLRDSLLKTLAVESAFDRFPVDVADASFPLQVAVLVRDREIGQL
jgi:hypothetical protein